MTEDSNPRVQRRGFVPHPARALAPVCLLCLAAFAGFVLLAWAVANATTLAMDRRILQRVADATRSWPLAVAKDVSLIGSDPVILVVAMAVIACAGWRRQWWDAGFVAAAVGGSMLLSTATKHLIGRERPAAFFRVAATGYSYPSGHALNSACFALVLGALLWRLTVSRGAKVAGSLLLAGYALCVGGSRMALGVHYPTDVLGGFLLAIAWVTLLIAVGRVAALWRGDSGAAFRESGRREHP